MPQYIVQPGDTLTAIAVRLNLCEQPQGNTARDWAPCMSKALEIAYWSGIEDVNVITPGQVLQLAPPEAAPPPGKSTFPLTKAVVGFGLLVMAGLIANDLRKPRRALAGAPGRRARKSRR